MQLTFEIFVFVDEMLNIRHFYFWSKKFLIYPSEVIVSYSGSFRYNYLRFRRKQVADKCPTDPSYKHVNNAYERALVFMHKVFLPYILKR